MKNKKQERISNLFIIVDISYVTVDYCSNRFLVYLNIIINYWAYIMNVSVFNSIPLHTLYMEVKCRFMSSYSLL